VSLVELAMKRREADLDSDAVTDERRDRLTAHVTCPGCGRLTRALGGTCSSCQRRTTKRPEVLPVVALLPTEYLLVCVAELKRRQAEIAAALGEAP
jgi:hypothetical protein